MHVIWAPRTEFLSQQLTNSELSPRAPHVGVTGIAHMRVVRPCVDRPRQHLAQATNLLWGAEQNGLLAFAGHIKVIQLCGSASQDGCEKELGRERYYPSNEA